MFASKRVDKCCFTGSKTRVQHFAIRKPSPVQYNTNPLLRYFCCLARKKHEKAPHLAPHRATPPSALPERDGPSLRARVASRGGAAPPARVPGPPQGAPRSVPSRRRRRDDRDARRARAGFSSERSQHSQRSDSERSERSSRKTENDADTSDTSVRVYVRRVPFVDLYAVLAVDPAASTAQINASWKRLQKAVHPDVAGAYAETAAALLNEARAVLVRPIDRDAHDSDRAEWLKRGGTDRDLFSVFATEPLSAWSGPSGRESASSRSSSSFSFEEFGGGPVANDSEKSPNRQSSIDVSRGVFVDESQCIGCVQCATTAPNTFRVETRFGRARVVDQWADGADAVADAVETCPVRCIHFVDPVLDLPILERVTARLWKERGGGGIGGIAAKRTGGDASPFEVVNALRRRADRKTGLAPWPSRRRRAASLPSPTREVASTRPRRRRR